MPDVRAIEWIRDGSAPDSILVRLPTRAEAGVELRIRVRHRQHSDIGGEMRVQRTLQSRDVVIEADDRAGNLAKRMHTSVGASRAVHVYARTLEACERVFEQALHRFPLGLSLPADESSAVVRECQLERASCH